MAITGVIYMDDGHSIANIEHDDQPTEIRVTWPLFRPDVQGWIAAGNTPTPFISDADQLAEAKMEKIRLIWAEAFARIEKAEAGMNPDNPGADPILATKRELKRKTLESYWIARAIKTGNLNWVTASDQASADQYMNVLIWMNNTRKEAADREDDVSAAADLAGVNAVMPVWPALT